MRYSKKAILDLVDPILDSLKGLERINEWRLVNSRLDMYISTDKETGHISAYVYPIHWDVKTLTHAPDTSREMCVYNTAGDIPNPTWEGLYE